MKKKFYVVWSGLNPGIYHSWDDCQAQIKGVKGAVYKSFDSKEEAERAYVKVFFGSFEKRIIRKPIIEQLPCSSISFIP